MGRPFRIPLAMAAVALLAAPVLTGSSLTGTATAAATTNTTTTTTRTINTTTTAAVTAEAAADPVYARLYNQGTGKCLAVPGPNTDVEGAELIQWTCSTSETQYWALIPVTGGYQVKNLASGRCLAVASNSKVQGAISVQSTCDGGGGGVQVWAHDSIDRLTNANSKFCLAVLSTETANGVKPAQWTCGTNKDQQWLW
ncbi:RICIN domain-containing protein [Streptomyces sp. NPDC014892]|uniref:RICIN domain-containing protein n=1 Tax=Streptomyces sp. NPDC014892 TaxID=3364930 RepID=UPI0036F69EE3